MQLYAIRHKPTGGFLPPPKNRNGRGGSHVEPEVGCVPRIFPTERAAKSALGQWLLGKFEHHWIGDEFGGEEILTVVPQPHRKREEMEIVPVQLILPEDK
jgi:hypothetical protein